MPQFDISCNDLNLSCLLKFITKSKTVSSFSFFLIDVTSLVSKIRCNVTVIDTIRELYIM